jgi:sterol desaturase/sphingolipid hydroxylase (fatty acid hydroxylase superfamily)
MLLNATDPVGLLDRAFADQVPAAPSWLVAAAAWFISNPYYCWALGPIVASFVGWAPSAAFLEWATKQKWAQKHMIQYEGVPRAAPLRETHTQVSWTQQLHRTLMFVGGPFTMLGFFLNAVIFQYIMPEYTAPLPTAGQFVWEFVLLMISADFFLYWAHRAAHEVPLLWRGHCVHHRIETPSAVSTAFISTSDAFVHAGPPMSACAMAVRPHPVTYSVYLAYHLANSAHNHSGLNWWLTNALMLKWLPLRSGNDHHDTHHKYSNMGAGAKNYGDTFVVWDWLFGSMDSRHCDFLSDKVKAQ